MIYFLRRLSIQMLKIENWALAIFTLLFLFISASAAYLLEPETYGTWFTALYWVLTTMATVGYGDYSPHTTAGMALTIFIYIFGIGLLSLIIGKIIDGLNKFHKRRESGRLQYLGKNHIVIINWSKKAQYAVEELLENDPKIEIVIIDDSDKHPYMHSNVQFVSGDPTSESTLLKANIDKARSAILFADARIDDPSLMDGKSLLIASGIESIAPEVHTTVEIMQEKHIKTFLHIQVNEFILSYNAVSRLAARSALREGNIDIITQLLSKRNGSNIYYVPKKSEWKTYQDAFHHLLLQGATLISDRNDMTINCKLNEIIPHDARLYVVCDPEVHQKIIANES
ncbi:potassium channel family protein [Paenibacillus marinisediminis]